MESQGLDYRLAKWQHLLTLPKARVGVIYGGDSAEREISIMSGTQVHQHLLEAGVDAFAIDLANSEAKAQGMTVLQQLQTVAMDVAFVVLHGPGGEDGTMQAVLDHLRIPYIGSGVMASSIAMHKLMTKMVWQAAQIKTPAWQALEWDSDYKAIAECLGLPLVIKPVHEGSSLGVHIVKNVEQMATAHKDAAHYGRQVMAETYIDGDEYTVAIIDGLALPAIKLATENQFYDMQAKYYATDTKYDFNNDMSQTQQAQMEAECERAFAVLECRDWGRLDIIRDKHGNNWLLEINTLPGMTSHSLVPRAARQIGLEFSQLVVLLVNLCLTRQQLSKGK